MGWNFVKRLFVSKNLFIDGKFKVSSNSQVGIKLTSPHLLTVGGELKDRIYQPISPNKNEPG